MSNVWLYIVLLIFSLQTFTYSYAYFGVMRTVMSLSHQLVEGHIEYLEHENNPYFRSETLESAIETYLSTQLEDYTSRYFLGFYYFNPFDRSPCTSYCQGVTITIKITLMPWNDYQQSVQFVIRQNYESALA